MAFYLSPGVYVKEYDLTTIVPAVGTTQAAFAGSFSWGPINHVTTVSNELELVSVFGRPNNRNFRSFFTCANFLSYSDTLRVVRAANTSAAKNATANGGGVLIENQEKYEINYMGLPATSNVYGMFAAKYAGELGDSIKVTLFADAGVSNTVYETWVSNNNLYYREFDGPPGTSIYATLNGGANDEMHILVIDEDGKFTGIANTVIEKFPFVSKAIDAKNDDGSSNYYVNVINDRSRYIYILNEPENVSQDIIRANVATINIDVAGNNYVNGAISFDGGSGSGIQAYANVNSTNAIVSVTIVNRGQDYLPGDTVTVNIASIVANTDPANTQALASLSTTLQNYVANTVNLTSNWGISANGTTFTQPNTFYSSSLSGGNDGLTTGGLTATNDGVPDGSLRAAYDKFKNSEEVDISLVLTGAASQAVSEYVLENISEYRKDCVTFISPEYNDVVDQAGLEVDNIVEYRNQFNSSSYGVLDNNWKYQFDKYNNVYRWVPLNGDIAGLCARTDYDRDPWFSPAGFNRGFIKNVVKLAWNADKTDRDDLYKNNINPVVTFPGEGVVLYGDKTMQFKPSAFDRINVRRLFIVLEKAIARAARYSLFEFNDEFTRAQFISLVEPFLRDVKGRRGIFDFRVVCDDTNNTPERIDRNEFWGDIYIKPARSINFIQLNFVAVRTGVAFEEIVGKF